MKIILGITGSVATVLVSKLVKELVFDDHEVRIVATAMALKFMPKEFCGQELFYSKDYPNLSIKVYQDNYEWTEGGYHKNDPVRHIEFRDWADLMLIAPLTANTLAKIAYGMADNFLTCIARAWLKERPFLIAPAMNTEMWEDPITDMQISSLGYRFMELAVINPIEKKLACGCTGVGAMDDIKTIVETVARYEKK
jgi:phosphopantothenoylcysteine decarboxylase